ncbi:Retrovirus-related Pol polyprotein from transposon RE1 [Vitis vinifera]|uniref:Retrovirus-related Pol polyprotein from transposon RE1 n=1 Tax=Vitis vinifera TaxID=29760 RepID=A0A438G6J1_VITVI|nr:Retrovirus-related Pol polyprotein from transposon RE1 [Vitis vinifera]
MSNQFQLFLSSNGIQHRRTCPHTPQQNGVAERKHRHVVEMGLSLLAQSLLPTKFWVDAFLTSIFLINRLPTSTLDNQTPYLKLFGKHPDYTSLRTFGCACFPLLRPYATHKLMFRSKRCIFLGYSSHQNGYRCLDPVTQKVLISRHVVFNENTFPAKDGLQSSELLPVVSSQGTTLPSPSFSLSTSNLQHSSPIISDSPDSPLESLPIPTSPHISTLPSPIPGPAPTPSSNHSHHPMTTRSQTGNLKPRTFSDFKLYSTHYPLQALSSTVTPLAPTSYRQAALLPDWCVAMREEYDALLANETWKLCEVDRFKARLVALGFAQEEGIDFTETFSPVIKPSTVRVLLTLSVQFDWEIRQLDVSNAFLHGILLEDVYMEQPKGFVNSDFPDYVCKLNKSLYGLKQAPRAWFMRLSQTLLEFGFLSSPVDASLFVYHKGHIHLFILIYVDDILVTGTDPSLIQSLIQKLQTEFKMKDLGPLGYFLGIQASRDSFGLHLRQSKYIGDLLHRTKMAGAKPASSPCTTGLKLSTHVGEPLTASQITEYRQTVGALQYCTLTRPDIAFSVNQLCQHMHCPNSVHWTAAKRVLRYLKGTIDLGLWYTKGEQTLQAFCDSDWAGNPGDRRSTTGTEAEYRALAITTAELYWIRMLLKELHISLPTAPTIWCDNSGALALASNPVFHARTKHIEVDFHFIREKVANRDISLQFIGSYDQPADIFTKGLSLARFCLLRDKLMVVSLPISLRGDDNHNIQTTEISLASHLSYPPDKCLSTLRDNS